jgi:hypothetical protein
VGRSFEPDERMGANDWQRAWLDVEVRIVQIETYNTKYFIDLEVGQHPKPGL